MVGDYVLAGVVAFCWAVPEESAMEKSWRLLDRAWEWGRWHTDCGGMVAGAVLLLADLRSSVLLDGKRGEVILQNNVGTLAGDRHMKLRLGV